MLNDHVRVESTPFNWNMVWLWRAGASKFLNSAKRSPALRGHRLLPGDRGVVVVLFHGEHWIQLVQKFVYVWSLCIHNLSNNIIDYSISLYSKTWFYTYIYIYINILYIYTNVYINIYICIYIYVHIHRLYADMHVYLFYSGLF